MKMDQETAMLRPQTGQSDASNLSTATDTELGARSKISWGYPQWVFQLCRGVGFVSNFGVN